MSYKQLSLELSSPRSLRSPRTPAELRAALDLQKAEKERELRQAFEKERSGEIQAITRWKSELETAKRQESVEKYRKRVERRQLEKEYAKQYQAKAALAAKERATEEARLLQVIRESQDEERRQEQLKRSRRHAFQAIIQDNEVQRKQNLQRQLTDLQRDVEMQKQYTARLERSEKMRQQEVFSRVLRQQKQLGEHLAKTLNPETYDKRQSQRLYREILDSQVQEHRRRDLKEWRLLRHNES